ncbi:MAG TPA: hypothetical protein PK074_12965 [Spirochaetales bacterium]|nr:hypothetical protein [Spirochaetales bacterium]
MKDGASFFHAIKEAAIIRKLKKYKPTPFMAADSTYSKDAADYAVAFVEALCHTKGSWAGQPFVHIPAHPDGESGGIRTGVPELSGQHFR